MSKRNLANARIILTGASSGIGRALALELARYGARLILNARREERLRELAEEIAKRFKIEAIIAPGDVTNPATRERALQLAKERLGGLDILINNAGMGTIGPFAQSSEERMRRIMEVNFFAPVEWTRAALPLLRKGKNPLIANVSSVLGHRAVPKKSEYCASKFALHGWSDALRAELARDKEAKQPIDVLLISPSTTQSEFFEVAEGDKKQLPWLGMGAATSEWVAKKSVRAMRKGKHEVILTLGGKALVWLDRLMPTSVNKWVARLG